MNERSLQHLERLSPREAWSSESSDFTPWLARPENFAVLADTLRFADAEVQATEKAIGDFYADIVARDREGHILVENQLEQTDHTHLGQIITYLAGLEGPVKVVWVTTAVREEHRAAIDWLNAHTSDEFSFFAVELELFRIGNSPLAPHFNVVAKPNDWSRNVSQRARQIGEMPTSERQQRYMEFWSAFGDYLAAHDPTYNRRTPSKDYWWNFAIGRAGFTIAVSAGARDHWINVSLVCSNDPTKAIFDHFHSQRQGIEKEFGDRLNWNRLDGKTSWDIGIDWRKVDPMDKASWPEYFAWYWDKLQKMRKVFTQRIRTLDLDDLRAEAEEINTPKG